MLVYQVRQHGPIPGPPAPEINRLSERLLLHLDVAAYISIQGYITPNSFQTNFLGSMPNVKKMGMTKLRDLPSSTRELGELRRQPCFLPGRRVPSATSSDGVRSRGLLFDLKHCDGSTLSKRLVSRKFLIDSWRRL